MEFFTCKHLRMAEKNLDKLCKGNLPELHIPYYKRFQVDFLTQICDKTQMYVYSRYRKKICVKHRSVADTEYVFQVAPTGRYLKYTLYVGTHSVTITLGTS